MSNNLGPTVASGHAGPWYDPNEAFGDSGMYSRRKGIGGLYYIGDVSFRRPTWVCKTIQRKQCYLS